MFHSRESLCRLLGQITNLGSTSYMNAAGGGLTDAGQNEQQRRFTNTIGPHQAHFAIVRYADRYALEEILLSLFQKLFLL